MQQNNFDRSNPCPQTRMKKNKNMSCNILLFAKNKKQVVSVPHDPSKIDEAKIEESPIAPHEASFFPQEVFHDKMSHILMGREGSPANPSPPQEISP